MSGPQTEEEWLLVLDVIERLQNEVRAGNWDALRKMLHGHTKPASPAEPAPGASGDALAIAAELEAEASAEDHRGVGGLCRCAVAVAGVTRRTGRKAAKGRSPELPQVRRVRMAVEP